MYKMFASWSTSKWPSIMYNKDDLMFFLLKMFPVTWVIRHGWVSLQIHRRASRCPGASWIGPAAVLRSRGMFPMQTRKLSALNHSPSSLPHVDFLNLGRSKLSVIFITFLSRSLWPRASGPQELLCCEYIIQISDFSGSSLNLISMAQVFGEMVEQNMIKSGSWCPCSKDCPQGES